VHLKAEDEKTAVDDLRSECEMMHKVENHPNIVNFVGAVTEDNHLAIVTEFCPGGSLDKLLLDSSVELTQLDKVRIAKEAASAISHLHSENVIHRDIAARNMLIGEGGKILVSDFGMARFKNPEADVAETKTNVGPIRWMSPEAIQHREYSSASDVFSFGVFLWELDTRKLPWEGTALVSVAVAISSGQRLPLDVISDPVFKKLIQGCWKTNPKKRLTMNKICDELTNYYKELGGSRSSRTGPSTTVNDFELDTSNYTLSPNETDIVKSSQNSAGTGGYTLGDKQKRGKRRRDSLADSEYALDRNSQNIEMGYVISDKKG